MSMTKNDLKNQLVELYRLYLANIDTILDILESQGKTGLIKKVKKEEIKFDDLLMSDSYYITNLDICIIANYYKVPLIILSSTKLIENDKALFVAYSANGLDFYFIKSPGVRGLELPEQRLIYTPNGAKVNILQLERVFLDEIRENIDKNNKNLENYILTFDKNKKKRQKLKIVAE